MDEFYEILGVPITVSDTELKRAYRDLTKVWHPDRFSGDPRLQAKAQEKLKEINNAYDCVCERRRQTQQTMGSASPHSESDQQEIPEWYVASKQGEPLMPLKWFVLLFLLGGIVAFFLLAKLFG